GVSLFLGLLADRRGVVAGVGADPVGVLDGVALDLGRAGLGALDDRADPVAGGVGQRLAACGRAALELLHLIGQRSQMGVDRVAIVAPVPDGEVLLLDAVSVKRHLRYLRVGKGESAGAAYRARTLSPAPARPRRRPRRAGASDPGSRRGAWPRTRTATPRPRRASPPPARRSSSRSRRGASCRPGGGAGAIAAPWTRSGGTRRC